MSRAERRRTALLAASALALVLACTPDRVAAQAFQGSGAVPAGAGGATITSGSGTTTIDVTGPSTVINWTPSDTSGPAVIDFLPNGTTATFRSDLTDYTVLNRILPSTTSAIGLNGTIQSTVFNPNAEGQATGGNVWFYTPYGFVVGSNATISVGSLVLTTNDIGYTLDAASGQANFLDANGAINFRGTANSSSAIVNNSLTATGITASSYIAFVAPRIEQRGNVSAGRSIAYVAGESVDLKIDAGMFDIAVLTGTTDAEGVVHTGTTSGSQSTGFFDTKTISMIAIPKNDALTMMLSGSIGYAAAASAFNDGSSIVLLAGNEASPAGNIAIGNSDFANSVSARATGDITASVSGSAPQQAFGNIRFRGFSTLEGDNSVTLTAGPGGSIVADQPLTLYSEGTGDTGGMITVSALGAAPDGTPAGTIDVSGYLQVSASAYGTTNDDATVGSNATGGAVRLVADGGSISTGSLYLFAEGYGGSGSVTAGNGLGGSIEMRAGYGGTITSGYTYLGARGAGGFGAADASGSEGIAGHGTGGTITLADSGTTFGLDAAGGGLALGFVDLNATGDGGFTSSGLNGGDGFGGSIDLTIGRQSQSWDFLNANVSGYDGSGSFDPIGGTIAMSVTGGAVLTLLSGMNLYADAVAGVDGGPGAFGRGGTIDLVVDQGAMLEVLGDSRISASAYLSGLFVQPDSTPDLTGGTVNLRIDGAGSEFATGNLFVHADATNSGADSFAGVAEGGTISVEISNGGAIDVMGIDGTEGFTQITANGAGGNGVHASDATGGTVTLSVLSGGRIDALNPIDLSASAGQAFVADGGGEGNSGVGGTVTVNAIGGTIAPRIQAYAISNGGYTPSGTGGDNVGGTISLTVSQGGSLLSTFSGQAYASGGATDDGDGGSGTGGHFSMLTDATANLPAFALDFTGYGSGGTSASGTGGDGFGGSARVDILGGTHTWDHATILTFAQGASSTGTGSIAGSATGDADGILFRVGESAALSITNGITLDARALGGVNGGANTVTGGSAGLLVDGGATLAAGSIRADASATIDGELDAFTIDTSPTARGGTVSIVADNGTVLTPLLVALANGETVGAQTSAGEAYGGSATVGAANGGTITIEGQAQRVGIILEARGLGGEGPSAAHAFGGEAALYTAGGTIVSPFSLEVDADAEAGSFAGLFTGSGIASEGYNAVGGVATVEMRAGATGSGTIAVPGLSISAQGRADGAQVEGTGGLGTGGTALLTVAEGDMSLDGILSVDASGYGGASNENLAGTGSRQAGEGLGGTATFTLSGGTVTAPEMSVIADGYGAYASGGMAGASPSLPGSGVGGTATFSASGGTLVSVGGIEGGLTHISASGFGGDGAFNGDTGPGGNGGEGVGGSALFEAPAGSTASLTISNPILVEANGVGGFGGSSVDEVAGLGGNASGGSAAMRMADIGFDFGQVHIGGSGFAGQGSPGAIGHGGQAEFALVDSGNAAAGRAIDELLLHAMGTDYFGETATGDGGTVVLTVHAGSPAAALTIEGALLADASGASAPAGNGFVGAISGAPVTVESNVSIATPRDAILSIATDGALEATGDLSIAVGRTFTSTGAISTLANADVQAFGGISMTDLSAGGTTFLQALAGPVVVSRNLLSSGLVTVRGTSVGLVSLGALAFADADATAGDLSIAVAGDLDLATTDATGAVTLVSAAGTIRSTGAVNGTDLTFIAGGDVISDTMLSANGNLTVDAGGSFVTPTASASATGNVSLSADLGLDLATVVSGGTTSLRADMGAILVDSLTSPGAVTALGQAVSLVSPGALTFASATATAGNLSIAATGNLTLAGASAAGSLALASATGSTAATGPLAAGGDTSVSGATGVALGNVTSGGGTALSAPNGSVVVSDLRSGGAVTATGRAVTITSGAGLTLNDAQATAGSLAITTAQGLTLGSGSATGTLALAAGGNLVTSGTITAAGATLRGANVTLGGAVDSTAGLTMTADQVLTVNAAASGTAIDATSADIVIGSAGRIGSRGRTQTLTLTNGSSSAPLAIGGAAATGRYSLDSAEAARIFADETITISGGSSDIGVGDLAMSFGSASTANIGSGGTLKLDTSGNVTVNGAVTLATSSAEDTFSIDPERIDVIAGSGSIAMMGSAGVPLGNLMLEGGTVAVASQQAIDAIAAASDFAAIAALLDQPGPAGPAGGYLQAGTIDVLVDNGLYIQNGGTGTAFDDRRGFTAQEFSIRTGVDPAQISINGVIVGPSGTITGLAVAPLVTINGSPAVDYTGTPIPTINGCAVNVDCARPDLPGQSRSDLEQPLSSDGTAQAGDGDLLPGSLLVSLSETQPLIAPPLVDEPITGVGNDDFWQVHCEPGDDRAECPAGDRED